MVEVAHAGDGGDRSEHFAPQGLRPRVVDLDERRLVEVSPVEAGRPSPAADEPPAALEQLVHRPVGALVDLARDEGAEVDLAHGVTDAQLVRELDEALHEGLEDRVLDVEALGRHADLAGVEEGGEARAVGGDVELRVSEHDEGVRRAQLEQQALHAGHGGGHDPLPRGHRAREGDHVRALVGDEPARALAVAVSALNSPSGRASKTSPSMRVDSGVSSEGLTMQALPAASAAAACQASSTSG